MDPSARTRRLAIRLALWLLVPGAHACSETADRPIIIDGGNDASSQEDARESDAGRVRACHEDPIPVRAKASAGVLNRLFVEVSRDEGPAAFLLDTGSSTTFLTVPKGSRDPTRNAGEVTIGTCKKQLDGRPYATDEKIDGLQTIGTLGVDALLQGTSELDLESRRIVRYFDGEVPSEISSWPTVPIDIVQGLVLAHVSVDNHPLRLMVDTGSPHVLWLGQQGKPGDKEQKTSDAVGNILTLYLGQAQLELVTGAAETVPVLRAPSFPYLEETVRILGGNVDGLLGLSALGPRRIVFDARAGVLRIGPRPSR